MEICQQLALDGMIREVLGHLLWQHPTLKFVTMIYAGVIINVLLTDMDL